MNDRIPGSSWSNPIKYRGFEIGPSEDDDPRNPRPFAAVRSVTTPFGRRSAEFEASTIMRLQRDIDKHYAMQAESNGKTDGEEILMPIYPFGVSIEDIEKIRTTVTEAWEKWGDDDGPTCDRIRRNGMWNDHIAMQAGIAVYKAMKAGKI